ncbi:hypothetical protein [Bacillus thuringiensis]|uniref:hypothetical protein n=1 Tax=Bacillus thuringiensis TaxID=1428 RepID=UPI0005CE0319|nr:hypothetical protein [Bacillus thuringiensis]
MRKELMEVVENYINWIQIQFEDNVHFIGDDYIDSVEDMFQEEEISYSQDDLQQTMKEIIRILKEEYGSENIFYNSPEHTFMDDNRYVTIYNQLIVKNKDGKNDLIK